MENETYDFVLPAFWLVAIWNDDTTALSDDDCKALDAFLDNTLFSEDGTWDIVDDMERFVTYHDAKDCGVGACDCYVFRFTTALAKSA